MPATAVGSAKGRSTAASIRRRPGKRYRVSTQARITPKTVSMAAAASAMPKLTRKAARIRGSVAIADGPAPADARRPPHQHGEREEDDQAEVEQREAHRRAEAGQGARPAETPPPRRLGRQDRHVGVRTKRFDARAAASEGLSDGRWTVAVEVLNGSPPGSGRRPRRRRNAWPGPWSSRRNPRRPSGDRAWGSGRGRPGPRLRDGSGDRSPWR